MIYKAPHNEYERRIDIRRQGRGYLYTFFAHTHRPVAVYSSVWPMIDEPDIASNWLLARKVPVLSDLGNRNNWELEVSRG